MIRIYTITVREHLDGGSHTAKQHTVRAEDILEAIDKVREDILSLEEHADRYEVIGAVLSSEVKE